MQRICTATAMMVCALLLVPAGAGATPESRMLDELNSVRKANGLDPLRGSDSLNGSAKRYSHWLMANDSFGHQERIQASSEFAFLGEALALHAGRRFRVQRTVARWMASPTHRALVLTRTMPWVGAGVTRGRFGSRPSTIWVLQLGRLKPPAVPVPSLPLP